MCHIEVFMFIGFISGTPWALFAAALGHLLSGWIIFWFITKYNFTESSAYKAGFAIFSFCGALCFVLTLFLSDEVDQIPYCVPIQDSLINRSYR